MIIVAFGATAIVNNSYDFSFLMKIVAIIFYTFAAAIVVDLIKKATKTYSIHTILEWIVYVALVQAALSFILFFIPSIKDLYLSIVNLNEIAENIMLSQSAFRLIAVSKFQYANMAVMYGFALLSVITLSFIEDSFFHKRKLFCMCVILILIIAGILSARTFFLMMFFSFVYYIYLLWHKIGIKVVPYTCLIAFLVIGVFYLLFSFLENSEYERTFNWAFEWYLNLSESGSLETESSNTLKEMYVFPDSIKTWWIGDGLFYTKTGGFYMNTDVGYLRNLFYWGILGSILVYTVQYAYYQIVVRSVDMWLLKQFCLFILLWVFIYNVKEFWYADIYWALLLAAFVSCNFQKKQRRIC